MNKQAVNWEKVFAKYVSEKVLVSRMHQELLQFRNKETNNSFIFIKAKDLRDTSKRRYAMTNKHIKKYLTLLAIGICKSKPPGAAVTTTQETATLPLKNKARMLARTGSGQDIHTLMGGA